MSIIQHNFDAQKFPELVRTNNGLTAREKYQLIELLSVEKGGRYDVDKARSRSRHVQKLREKGFVRQVRKHENGRYDWTLEVFSSPTPSYSGIFYTDLTGNEKIMVINYVNNHNRNYTNQENAHIKFLDILKNDTKIKEQIVIKYNLSATELSDVIELKMIDDFKKNTAAMLHKTYEAYAQHFINSRRKFIENYRQSANIITETKLREEIALLRKAIQYPENCTPSVFKEYVTLFLKKTDFGLKRGWLKIEEDNQFVQRVRDANDGQGGIGELYILIKNRNQNLKSKPTYHADD